jgi:PTS system nitrogen regulatory IIA component
MTIMKNLQLYLEKAKVYFLNASGRDDAIEQLVDGLVQDNIVHDKEEFFHAVLEREKIVSTAVGKSVAIPHARLPSYDSFFICLGILEEGVDWQALDGSSVRLIILIGGPDDKQTEYLQILSAITVAVKDEERRKNLLTAKTVQQALDQLKYI